MENTLTVFNEENILGKAFKIYGTIEEPLFLAKDVASWIEHKRARDMIQVVDEDERMRLVTATSGGDQEAWFLTEYGLYEVLMQSRKPIAKQFKKEIKEILKNLRLKGVVIMDYAAEEAIDFEKKFGKYRIRKTFTESQNLQKDWKQLKELSKAENKAKRLTGKDRIKLYNIAFAAVLDRLNSGLTELRGSELMALQEMLTDIKSDTLELSNRVNGGKKADLTKRLAATKEQLEEAYEYIESIAPDAEEYICLDLHGFTVNKQYEPDITEYGLVRTDYSGKPKLRKTEVYKKWIANFNKEMDKLDLKDIDFSNGIDVYLYFDHRQKFDCHNFHKSFFDAFSNYFGVDDKNFHLKNCDTNDYVNSYEDGKIYFCIRER